ncbi:hypothetical protein MRB53_020757 [Persea americana]|uniref:Uncharacterized protein n=1 Tax=Persea americana TaxID=3435 RepID=A0ACC2L212_PERAE|nr:hypothetical protein MRB53_020757 [Persea americana]
MATHILFLVLLFICSSGYAYDPSPLQDFCVADLKSPDLFVSGLLPGSPSPSQAYISPLPNPAFPSPSLLHRRSNSVSLLSIITAPPLACTATLWSTFFILAVLSPPPRRQTPEQDLLPRTHLTFIILPSPASPSDPSSSHARPSPSSHAEPLSRTHLLLPIILHPDHLLLHLKPITSPLSFTSLRRSQASQIHLASLSSPSPRRSLLTHHLPCLPSISQLRLPRNPSHTHPSPAPVSPSHLSHLCAHHPPSNPSPPRLHLLPQAWTSPSPFLSHASQLSPSSPTNLPRTHSITAHRALALRSLSSPAVAAHLLHPQASTTIISIHRTH